MLAVNLQAVSGVDSQFAGCEWRWQSICRIWVLSVSLGVCMYICMLSMYVYLFIYLSI